jgi:thiamine-phosphate pyrophosphorylase
MLAIRFCAVNMDKAGITLIIPTEFDLRENIALVESVVDAASDFNLACLRLCSAGLSRETLIKRGDALREIGHKRDISVIIDDHVALAQEIGLDGVHLTSADPKILRDARKLLGKDAIIGVFAGNTRHDGMVAGEIGVDYVSFGPLSDDGLGTELAAPELFDWWSEMIEVPLVAEGSLTLASLESVKAFADFVGLGAEVFSAADPVAALSEFLKIL